MTADVPSLSDPELVARIVGGDEVALGTAYDRHADVIYGSVLRFIGTARRRRRSQTPTSCSGATPTGCPSAGSLIGWLLRIARNKAIDRLRSRPADRPRSWS
jgi:RNA polymerase sigma-70 factor (ECF subfamily)